MEDTSSPELDYCDLEPGKICDNCCKCLDMDKPYNEIEAELLRTDRIDEAAALACDDFYYEDEEYSEGGEGEACDSSRVAPIVIDPALMAEWELRLRAYDAEKRAAYMRTLHGVRKRSEEKQGED